jgi:hypothetical protein
MPRKGKGGGAYWKTATWRYRLLADYPDDHGPWTAAMLKRDIKDDLEPGQRAEVQKIDRYTQTYQPHSVVTK